MKKWTAILLVILSLTLVGAATIITDNNVISPSGIYNNISTTSIDSVGEPLVYRDSVRGVIYAIFNGNSTFISTIALEQNISLPGFQTTFFGNVDNIDDVNDFSRFKETNLNNGSFAVAGFQGQNDLNHTMGFGVTSSNFAIGGIDLPNEGVTFSLAPGGTTFSNFLNQGFDWFVNKDDSVVSFDFFKVASLDEQGNFNISGNFTVDIVKDNSIFAQLISSVNQEPINTTPTVITYDTQEDINGLNHSISTNQGEITINTAGIYFISPQPQVGKDLGGVKIDFNMFLQVDRNGGFINEPNSNIKLTIKDPDITDVIVSSFTISLDSGDKIRMMQRVSDAGVGMGLKNTNATADVPRTPSIIFTIYRVGGQP